MNSNKKMNIPFFDLHRQYEEIKEEVQLSINNVLSSGQYIEGLAVKELERKLSEYLDVQHVITCGNGTDALRIALQASGIKQNDEVIVTSFSFFATAEAIAQLGAIPVFVDIRPDNFNMDPADVRKKITNKTKAILPVHIFGMPADMDEINAVAKEYEIPVVEDACQAIGAEYKGKKTGTLGDLGCFSFYPTKNLGAFGDGGMITTNSSELANICRAIKSHAAGKIGQDAYTQLFHKRVEKIEQLKQINNEEPLYDPCKYYNYFIGGNSRLDSIQAAVLLVKLKYLNKYNEKRTHIAKRYSNGLSGLPLHIPYTDTDRFSCWHQYAVLCEEKEKLINYLANNGINAGSFYPVPLHRQIAFLDLQYQKGSLPIAEETCKKTVCLPIFPELSDNETDYIISTIRGFYE